MSEDTRPPVTIPRNSPHYVGLVAMLHYNTGISWEQAEAQAEREFAPVFGPERPPEPPRCTRCGDPVERNRRGEWLHVDRMAHAYQHAADPDEPPF